MKKDQLANIAADESHVLNGFKVLGCIPFHLKYITVRTHIILCKIRSRLQQLKEGEEEIKSNDFYDADLQQKILPLVEEYCMTGLLNNRKLSFLFIPFLRAKLRRCSHSQIWNIYMTIFKLNEPAFFLSYWKLIMTVDNTLLKEAEQSSDTSRHTKKKQA